MAKPLNERIASARSTDRVTITDLKSLIDDAREERARQQARLATAETDAVDIALSEGDREDAAAAAASAGRLIRAYDDAITELEAKLHAKAASDKRAAEEREKAAALAERDEIAARFEELMPDAIKIIVGLCEEVEANGKRLKKAGLRGVLNAELSARGLTSGYVGYSPVLLFTEMKIPAWDQSGHIWPKRARMPGVYDQQKDLKRSEDLKAKAKAEWGPYRLTPPPSGPKISFEAKMPAPLGKRSGSLWHGYELEPWVGDLEHVEAERLRGLGVTVEKLDDEAFEARWIYYT